MDRSKYRWLTSRMLQPESLSGKMLVARVAGRLLSTDAAVELDETRVVQIVNRSPRRNRYTISVYHRST